MAEDTEEIQKQKVLEKNLKDSLDILHKEQESERNRKQSFETRAGMILVLLGVLCPLLLALVPLARTFTLIESALNSYRCCTTIRLSLKSLLGVAIYFYFMKSLVGAVSVITTSPHPYFNINILNDAFISQPRENFLGKTIGIYKKVVSKHRESNEARAKILKKSLYATLITFFLLAIYTIL